MLKNLRSIALIINYKTFLVTTLSIAATWVCVQAEWFADLNLSMISVALVFPIVFAINSAYQRREEALKNLAGIKAHAISIFLAAKHWGDSETADQKILDNISLQIQNVLGQVKKYLIAPDFTVAEVQVYSAISFLSQNVQRMREVVVATEISRINEYVSMLILDFENLKIIREYRTPITLRTYSRFFIYTFPVIFAPFFAATTQIFSFQFITYAIPVMYTFVLISLINIQEHMEDPFDGIGEDDIKIETERFGGVIEELDTFQRTVHEADQNMVANH